MQKLRLNLALHRIFNEAHEQLATGVVLDETGSVLPATVRAWVTLERDGPRSGRKKNLNRVAAVALAHEWHRFLLGMTASQADKALATLLDYSDERAVKRVRARGKREIEGRFFLSFQTAQNAGFAVFLETSATIEVSPAEIKFSGPGWCWNYGQQEATYQNRLVGRATNDPPLDERSLAEMRQWANGGGDINCK